jgi:hypothetical protein
VRYFLIQKFASVADDASDVPCQLVLQRLVSLFGLSDILEGEQWLGLITAVRTTQEEEFATATHSIWTGACHADLPR